MKKNKFLALILLLVTVLQLTFTGCENSSSSKEDDDIDPNAVVLKVEDYGAVGDGVTDDSGAIDAILDMAKMKGRDDTPVVIEFEKDKSYYFRDMNRENAIFDLTNYKNLTLLGHNTTIIMDKTMKLNRYVNIWGSENIKIKGFNYKFSQPFYTNSTADVIHVGTPEKGSGTTYHINKTDPPYVDITTELSLGITETYTPTRQDAFVLIDTDNQSRNHMFYEKIEVLDAEAQKYRIYLQDWSNVREYLGFMEKYDLNLLVGIPYWERGEKSDGSGSFVSQNSTNVTMEDLNVWASTGFVFHMRTNYGEFKFKNCNVTTEPGQDDKWAAQVDIFHLKENRCKFIIEDCLLEKAHDDVFNISTTYLYVNDVMSDTEFNMYCKEFDGAYNMPLEVGDTVTLVLEKTGMFVGRTKIKEVVEQSGEINHIIVEDPMPALGYGVSVYVDSLGQPDSVIRDCKINGTYRLRTPITFENCEINTMYCWMSNIPSSEGPIPRDITFKNCVIKPVKPEHIEMSYVSQDYMMQIGTGLYVESGVRPQFFVENVLFEDCDIDPALINTLGNTANISFVKDGKEYFSYKAE